MKKNTLLFVVSIVFSFLMFSQAWAHCDTYEGPVIKSAQKALEEKNVNLVLLWVEEKHELEIKEAFTETLENRLSNPGADHLFFEKLVEAHRLWEWEPYTWVKPKGTAIAEIIQATDKAIETKSLEEALGMIQKATEKKAEEMLHKVLETKNYDVNDIEAWRAYVKAYVEYTHYVEILHNIAEQWVSYLHTLHTEKPTKWEHDTHSSHNTHDEETNDNITEWEHDIHSSHDTHNEETNGDIMEHLHSVLNSESELKTKFKKRYIVKYWKIINSLNHEKLEAALEKINEKLLEVHFSNYSDSKKQQIIATLWAFYEIINEKLESH